MALDPGDLVFPSYQSLLLQLWSSICCLWPAERQNERGPVKKIDDFGVPLSRCRLDCNWSSLRVIRRTNGRTDGWLTRSRSLCNLTLNRQPCLKSPRANYRFHKPMLFHWWRLLFYFKPFSFDWRINLSYSFHFHSKGPLTGHRHIIARFLEYFKELI